MSTATTIALSDLLGAYVAERELSPRYCDDLAVNVRSFSTHLGRPATTADLIHTAVNPWLDSLEKAGRADTTVANARRQLLSLWRHAFDVGEMDRPPQRIRKVRCKVKIPQAWTMEELARLLDACERLGGVFRNLPVKRSLYMTAWVMTQFDTAIRWGDMVSLRREWLSSDGKLTIVQEKTGRVHNIRLRELTLHKVQQLIAALPGHDLIFPGFCSRHRWFRFFSTIRRRAGLPKGGTKMLRRSSASFVERERPGTAWRHLGHTRQGLDVAHYLDPRIVQPDATLPPGIGEYVRQKPTVDLDKLPTDARIRQVLTEPEGFGAAELREVLDYASSIGMPTKRLARRLRVCPVRLTDLANPRRKWKAAPASRIAAWLKLRGAFDLSPDSKPPSMVKDVDKLPANETIGRVLGQKKLAAGDVLAIMEYARRIGVGIDSLARRLGTDDNRLYRLRRGEARVDPSLHRRLCDLFSLNGGPAISRRLVVTESIREVLEHDPFEAADVRALVDYVHSLGIHTHTLARWAGIKSQHLLRLASGARPITTARRLMIRNLFGLTPWLESDRQTKGGAA